MYESLVPAVGMGGMGPLNRWVGSSAVVLTKQAAIANNCLHEQRVLVQLLTSYCL